MTNAVRRGLRRILLGVIVLLYAASIPWYRTAGVPSTQWLGLPDWVSVALLSYAAIAVLNAVAWMMTDIPDDVSRRPGSE